MFSTDSQILLATSCLLNKMQNESNYFLSLPQITTTTTKNLKPHKHLFPSIFNCHLKRIFTEVSGNESFMDFANLIQFLSKCNSYTTVGIQW